MQIARFDRLNNPISLTICYCFLLLMIKILAAGFSVLVRDRCIWLYCLPSFKVQISIIVTVHASLNTCPPLHSAAAAAALRGGSDLPFLNVSLLKSPQVLFFQQFAGHTNIIMSFV